MTENGASQPVYEPDQLRTVAVEVWLEYPVPRTRGQRRNHRARAEWFSGRMLLGTPSPQDLEGATALAVELAQRLRKELARNPLLTMTEVRV